ncbi:CD83 antigen [Paralichthys olivaceus]|uniref:CD83 n=1 Tax=Paralichthys olivaceus TaxID=8255 RepID=A0A0N7I625_PAROL|nr:CD83 transcript 1 [Paralichthys olivaceus]ALJ30158.1 CD83 transcript 2 [Paralichthys olivaceus]ARP51374.1 CD83 [Paralichthys olivaceus]
MTPQRLSLLCVPLLVSACVHLCGGGAVMGTVMECVSGADCVVQCFAEHVEGVQYRAVRWYRVRESSSSHLSGLLTRRLPNGTTTYYYGLDREVELLDESLSLYLPNVTCSDGGVYMCHLAAPLGEQNRDGQVLLILKDCPDGSKEKLTIDDSVILATVVLMVALIIFLISFISLKSVLRDKNNKTVTQETLLESTLRPLEKKDLMLIYTLGPKTYSMKHVCV